MAERTSAAVLAAALRAQLPLAKFIPAVRPDWMEPRHLKPFTDAVERIDAGERVRVVVSTPPRHAKTSVAQSSLPWLLMRHPKLRILYVTAATELAESKSREARQLARDVGLRLSEESQSLHEWNTPEGGGVVAVGAGGQINGRGFNVIIADDLVANSEAANSEVQRKALAAWWRSTLVTRCEPGASVVAIGTRWHEADLLADLAADATWLVVNLPAINDAGEALWPERFPLSELAIQRSAVGSYVWEALYQGRPSSPEGNIFRREWFKSGAVPEPDYRIMAVDGAWKTGLGSDYSVIACWGLTQPAAAVVERSGHHDPPVVVWLEDFKNRYRAPQAPETVEASKFVVCDVWRARVEMPDLISKIREIATRFRPHAVLIEDTASGIGAIQVLSRETALPIKAVQVAGRSKELRASMVAPLFEAGRVRIPQAPWVADWIEEHCAFPAGRHDDRVDSTSLALEHLAEVVHLQELRGRHSPLSRRWDWMAR